MCFFDLEEDDCVFVQVMGGNVHVLQGGEIAERTNLTIGSFILLDDEFGIGQPAQILKYSKASEVIREINDGQSVTDLGTQTHSETLMQLSIKIEMYQTLQALKRPLQIIKEKEENVLLRIRRVLTFMNRSNGRAARNGIRAGAAARDERAGGPPRVPVARVSPRCARPRRGRGATLMARNVAVDMVSIGNNGTEVPKHVMDTLRHCPYTKAVRILLQQVFTREVLATHSLTGKKSPAFADKAPRPRLDPKKVEDIVNAVLEQCPVKVCYVRKAITTKLADEHKMSKQRLLKARPHSQ